MRHIPVRVDGVLLLLRHGMSTMPMLIGGDRPGLQDSGFQELRIYEYTATNPVDATFEQYQPGKWRRYHHSEWCKAIQSLSDIGNATFFKMPRYRGAIVSNLHWPVRTLNGTSITVVLGEPAGVWPRERRNVKPYLDTRMNTPAQVKAEHERFHALASALRSEGVFATDVGFTKTVPVSDLEFEPEPEIPAWLREVLSEPFEWKAD